MKQPCGCITLAGPAASYWTGYKPYEIRDIVSKYRGDFWWTTLGIPASALADVSTMIGKWVYYFQQGNFPNTTAGRQSAAAVIAKDISATSGFLYPADTVFNVLQNANAYLIKELKVPPTERGPDSLLTRIDKKVVSAGKEFLNRTEDAAQAVEAPFKKAADSLGKVISSPWSWGAAALIAGAVVAVKVLPGRKSR